MSRSSGNEVASGRLVLPGSRPSTPLAQRSTGSICFGRLNIGSTTAVDLASSEEVAVLNYTGGTTGKSKGAIRTHAQLAAYSTSILADFGIPIAPRYLVIAPMSHVAGTKILPSLMLGGTVHLLRGFDPDAVLTTIARERNNVTVLVKLCGRPTGRATMVG
jgi:acyl-CoA synthetase (AMP-forming)/AMP-acid ligase II